MVRYGCGFPHCPDLQASLAGGAGGGGGEEGMRRAGGWFMVEDLSLTHSGSEISAVSIGLLPGVCVYVCREQRCSAATQLQHVFGNEDRVCDTLVKPLLLASVGRIGQPL